MACVSGFRGRVGFYALIAAILLPLAIGWRFFLPVLAWLLVILGVVRGSKEQLAPYYRWHKEQAP